MNRIIALVVFFVFGTLAGCSDSFSPNTKKKSSSSIQSSETSETNQNGSNVDEQKSSDTSSTTNEDVVVDSEQALEPAVVSGGFLTKIVGSDLSISLICNTELDKENVNQTFDVVGCNILNKSKEKIIDIKLKSLVFYDGSKQDIRSLANDISTNSQDDWTILARIEEGKAASIMNVKIKFTVNAADTELH